MFLNKKCRPLEILIHWRHLNKCYFFEYFIANNRIINLSRNHLVLSQYQSHQKDN